MELISAILHLGNFEFVSGQGKNVETSTVANREEVKIVATLLKVDPATLEQNVTSKLMEIKGCDPTRIPLTPVQALDATNALAKVSVTQRNAAQSLLLTPHTFPYRPSIPSCSIGS